MKIDVTSLLTGRVDKLNVDESIDIPKERYENTRINSTKDIHISGSITRGIEADLILDLSINGSMNLNDDVTLENVDYTFESNINESIPDNEYIIDITDIIVENILTEIPSKVRGKNEKIHLSGDGWRLISEEEYEREHSTNPFANLSEMISEKEE